MYVLQLCYYIPSKKNPDLTWLLMNSIQQLEAKFG